MAVTERNFFVFLASATLFVAAVRDLYDTKCRGTKRTSTWFMALFNFIIAMALLMFLR